MHHQTLRSQNNITGQQSSRVRNLLQKIKEGRPLTMVAIGGSNTAGGGLTSNHDRYLDRVADWWNKGFYRSTGSKMDSYSIAISGTGSDFFGFCLQNFLQNHTEPDIVLLEFAINDGGDAYGQAAQPMEVLTRRVMLLSSQPLIIYVNLVNPEVLTGKILNTKCRNMQNMGFDELAKHYGTPSFSIKDVACPLTNGRRVLDNSMIDMFASDGAHTSSIGHEKVATMVTNYLESVMVNQTRNSTDKQTRSENRSKIEKPLFINPSINDNQLTNAHCWSHTTSNWKIPLRQTMKAHVIKSRGFKYRSPYKARWVGTMRTDAGSGWLARAGQVELTIRFTIPRDTSTRSLAVAFQIRKKPLSIQISVNDKNKSCIKMVINENSVASVTQIRLFPIATEISPGNYTLKLKGKVKWLNVAGLVAGFGGYHGYKGYKTFEGTITKC